MRRWMDKLPWFAAAAFVFLSVAWLSTDKNLRHGSFERFSIHNISSDGLSLAYQYLRSEAGSGSVSVLTRPLERSFLEPKATLLRIAPDSSVPPGLQKPVRMEGG